MCPYWSASAVNCAGCWTRQGVSVRGSIHSHEDSCSSQSRLLNSASHAIFDHAEESSKYSHGVSLKILDRMCVDLSIYQVFLPVLIGIVHRLARFGGSCSPGTHDHSQCAYSWENAPSSRDYCTALPDLPRSCVCGQCRPL